MHLSAREQLSILAILMLTSKGAAGVTGSGFVTLAATLAAIPTIPPAALALLVGVDRFMSEVRAITNLIGALVGHAVAKTVSSGLVDSQFVNSQTIICALFGGIVWNLLTWWLGLPSSSTHAMVGGLCGATLANAQNNWGAIIWSQEKVKDGKVVMEGVLHKVVKEVRSDIVLPSERFEFETDAASDKIAA